MERRREPSRCPDMRREAGRIFGIVPGHLFALHKLRKRSKPHRDRRARSLLMSNPELYGLPIHAGIGILYQIRSAASSISAFCQSCTGTGWGPLFFFRTMGILPKTRTLAKGLNSLFFRRNWGHRL